MEFATYRTAFFISALFALASDANAGVKISRLDCGHEPKAISLASFSDTMSFQELKLPLTYSCYLIRNGDKYLLWDTGLQVGEGVEAPDLSIEDQLKLGGLTAREITYVGLSHYHYDHTGQLSNFSGSTLLIGKDDWDLLQSSASPPGVSPNGISRWRTPFSPWLNGTSALVSISRADHDVFGDGQVRILALPGHTPGHQALLVKLERRGYVLLSGDVAHFLENLADNGVPTWNTNRADSLASLDRFRKIAAKLEAEVIIQHDPRDVNLLPEFPSFAE